MTPFLALLRALARCMRRDAGSLLSLKVNNFFLFVMLLIAGNVRSGQPPRSAYPFLLLLGLILIFPLSSDPLSKIPGIRLAAWPLTASTRAALRAASIALSPMFWLAVALFMRASISLAFLFVGLVAAIQGAGAAFRQTTRCRTLKFPPRIPGKYGLLVTLAARQMFRVLDTYLAVAIALVGCLYRFTYSAPDSAAYPILSILIALALSTYAQSLFGLDSPAAWTRYRLIPLTFREILIAKDAAFITYVLLLTVPFSALAGLSFGLTSLAIGHASAFSQRGSLTRWRFCGGRVFFGALQVIIGVTLALLAGKNNPAVALIPLVSAILGTDFFVTSVD